MTDLLRDFLPTFVILLREGGEAALAIGIVWAALRRLDRRPSLLAVLSGVATAIAASAFAAAALADVFMRHAESIEGFLMIAAAFVVGSLLVWMWRAARTEKGRIESAVARTAAGLSGAAALFALSFLLVVREGIETAFFLASLRGVDAGSVAGILGLLAGAGLSALLGVMVVRGSRWVDLRRFFAVTGTVLVVLVLYLVVGGVHELSEAGWLPASRAEMAFVGPIVNSTPLVVAFSLLVACAGLAWPARASSPAPAPSPAPVAVPPNPADERKRLAGIAAARRTKVALAVLLGGPAAGLVAVHVADRPPAPDPATPLAADGDSIRVPVAGLGDAPRFHTAPGEIGERRFFVFRGPGGEPRLCMDACVICGPAGYYYRDPELICRNCGAPINRDTIGVPGGCNPIPVRATREGEALVVSVADLRVASGEGGGR
ncbi:MAG: Fe-S-containing protein [Planctomycetales bacterium]|nr:Fe-S-containing protein [Planctomycetales bacterium]